MSLPNEVLFKIANRLQSELIITVPVRTGRLRASINVIPTTNGLLIRMVHYGKHVEFGNSKQRPNPFIRTAIYTKLNSIISEEINRYYGN